MARLYAASLPLGNIIPCISSNTLNLSLARSSADVPPRIGVVLLSSILTLISYESNLCFSINLSTTYVVIIFVKLATYLYCLSYFANISSYVSKLIITHDLAETKGAGLSRLKYLVMLFIYSL